MTDLDAVLQEAEASARAAKWAHLRQPKDDLSWWMYQAHDCHARALRAERALFQASHLLRMADDRARYLRALLTVTLGAIALVQVAAMIWGWR